MFVGGNEKVLRYQVEKKHEGLKLIDVIVTDMKVSSRLLRKAKSKKCILLNGEKKSVNTLIKDGDIIELYMNMEENTFQPDKMPLDIVFENDDIMVINKSPFLVVHPTKGHPYDTLANGISYHIAQRGENYKIRFINRLDRDTSGLVLIAKNPYGQKIVSDQMIQGTIVKEYLAIVEGHLIEKKGTIDLPIGRKSEDDIKRMVLEDGDHAVTHYEVIQELEEHSVLKINIETGRTHQIRVHLSHIGHPILGDSLYGKESFYIDRQALHCKRMTLNVPREDVRHTFEANNPEDIERVMKGL